MGLALALCVFAFILLVIFLLLWGWNWLKGLFGGGSPAQGQAVRVVRV